MPQIAARTTRTIASAGAWIVGSDTSAVRTSPAPYISVAFMSSSQAPPARRFDAEGDLDRVPQAAAEARCPAVVSRYGPTDRDPRLPHLPAGPDHAGAG